MALTTASFIAKINWINVETPIAGQAPAKTIDSLSLSVPNVLVSTYNRRLLASYTVANGATQLIDLANFVDAYTGATITLTKATGIVITGTKTYTLGPNNAANPLQWFFGGTTQTVRFAAGEGMGVYSAVTFTTGSKLLLSNTDSTPGTFEVVILGGT